MADSTSNLLDQLNTKRADALVYAIAIQQKAAANGFDWPHITGVISKIHEELQEVSAEIEQGADKDRLQDELGDLLFACCNLARHLSLDPEQALQRCNNKFYRRFSHVEQRVKQQGRTMRQCTLTQLDGYWDEAKQLEKSTDGDNVQITPTQR